MNPILNIAIISARKAGKFIMKYYEYNNILDKKIKNNNFIYEIKNNAIQIIYKTIKRYYPNHNVKNKLSNIYKKSNLNKIEWIINPIDGIKNFNMSFPFFCITIAFRIKNRTEVSLIYDPIRNEIFSAIRGKGAQVNQYKIRINKNIEIENSIISIKCLLKDKKFFKKNFFIFNKILNLFKNIRCTGSDSLDFAYLSSGRIDGIINIGKKPLHKLIAGELIIRESGGLVTDLFGNSNYFLSDNIISGNPKFIKNILKLFNK